MNGCDIIGVIYVKRANEIFLQKVLDANKSKFDSIGLILDHIINMWRQEQDFKQNFDYKIEIKKAEGESSSDRSK